MTFLDCVVEISKDIKNARGFGGLIIADCAYCSPQQYEKATGEEILPRVNRAKWRNCLNLHTAAAKLETEEKQK